MTKALERCVQTALWKDLFTYATASYAYSVPLDNMEYYHFIQSLSIQLEI